MAATPRIAPGRLVSRHGRTRRHGFVLAIAAALFLLGVALPLLLLANGTFDHHPMIVATGACLCIAGVAVGVAWKAMGPKTVLSLHDRGVVIHHAGSREDVFVPFAAMGDLFLYRHGSHGGLVNGLAFRRDASTPWVEIMDNVGDAFRLRGAIIEGQLRERGPLTLRALEAGEGIVFHTVSDEARLARRAGNAAPVTEATPFMLSPLGVEFADRLIPIGDIASVDEGTTTGSLRLLDSQGNTLWGVHYLSLFSADLFIVLMRTLIEARQYGLGGVPDNKGY
ncbi:hypothetical protein KPL74_11140 [Bacillus sp. NP157]|nr:hypothetical protein KPL74_11140 [Bacillus sp. NP157]